MSDCPHTCVICVFKEMSLLKDLSRAELAILERNRKSVEYKKGETIYKEGLPVNELLCLNSGKAKVVKKLGEGEEHIVDLKKPVDFLGFQALMSNDVHQNSAVAIEISGICSINKKDLLEVIANNSEFALKVIEDQAKQLNLHNQRLIALTNKNMKARLCDTLLVVKDVFGIEEDGTLKVNIKRKEIAGLSNMTTANAIRTLSEIAKEGLVELKGKEIVLSNLPLIEKTSISA